MKKGFQMMVDEIRETLTSPEMPVFIALGDRISAITLTCPVKNLVFLGLNGNKEPIGLRIKSTETDHTKFEFDIKLETPMEVVKEDDFSYLLRSDVGNMHLMF